jgi:DNA-binding response OmpR family regulator
MKVLIADDDRTIRTLLADMLADLGHEVVAASNGLEAVDLTVREKPQIVFLDFLMPRLSGLDALKEIRAHGVTVPAVLVTAISDSSMKQMDGVEQAEVVLEKPFKRRTIEKAIENATRIRS